MFSSLINRAPACGKLTTARLKSLKTTVANGVSCVRFTCNHADRKHVSDVFSMLALMIHGNMFTILLGCWRAARSSRTTRYQWISRTRGSARTKGCEGCHGTHRPARTQRRPSTRLIFETSHQSPFDRIIFRALRVSLDSPATTVPPDVRAKPDLLVLLDGMDATERTELPVSLDGRVLPACPASPVHPVFPAPRVSPQSDSLERQARRFEQFFFCSSSNLN